MEIIINHKVKITRAAEEMMRRIENYKHPIINNYQLFLIFKELYKNPKGLYLRRDSSKIEAFRSTCRILRKTTKTLTEDRDYPSFYRIVSISDLPADEIVCIADPYCYISHLSAMQRYNLTDRRPKALHITRPTQETAKNLIKLRVKEDNNLNTASENTTEHIPLFNTHHPNSVRGRDISCLETKHWGKHIKIKGTESRISTIGQTFLDMIEYPILCGGMLHVIDVWKEHAEIYLDEIIETISTAPKKIHKVRAGYILDEIIKINRPEIDEWAQNVQRGGSRLLDPSKPYKNNFSEKWMISINV